MSIGNTGNDHMATITTPRWEWTWNLNTIVLLVGLGTGIAAWGATWAKMTTTLESQQVTIGRLDDRVSSIEGELRRLDTQDLRLTAVEQKAADAASAMRAVETTLNNLSSDMRLVREILQRLEDKGGSVRP